MICAPTGFSVITSGDKVSGVYPDVLRELGPKAGCSFNFPVVPRARLDHMFFKTSEADILIPASRSTERDKTALFVPLIQVSPALISLKTRQLGITSVKQLVETRALRGALVRTFSYGDEYQALLLELDRDKRIGSGAYLSRTSLDPADQDALRKLLTDAVKSNLLWNTFLKYYPTDVLRGVVTRTTP